MDTQFNFRIDSTLLEAARQYAFINGVTLGDLIREFLTEEALTEEARRWLADNPGKPLIERRKELIGG